MAVAFDSVGPSATPATSSSATTLAWNHTCGGTATYLLVAASYDNSPDSGVTLTATYNGVAMTSLGIQHTGASTAGLLQVWGLANPATGSAKQVLVTETGATGAWQLKGGSLSFSGAGWVSAAQIASGNTTSATESFTPTTTGGVVAAFSAAGSALTQSGSFTSRVDGGSSGQGAGFFAGATLASTGSAMTPSWTVGATDFWAVIAVEVQPWHVIQSNGGNSASASLAVSYTSNLSAGSKLIAAASFGGSGTATVKDAAGNNFNLIASVNLNNTAGSGLMTLWSLDVPAVDVGTTATITAARTSGNFTALVIQEVAGLAAGIGVTDQGAITNFGTMSVNASAATAAYSSTSSAEFLVAAYGDNEQASHTVGTPTGSTTYTLDAHSVMANANFAAAIAYGNSTSGAETASFAITGVTSASPWATIIVAFTPGVPAPLPHGMVQSRQHAGRRKGRRHGAQRQTLQPSFADAPVIVTVTVNPVILVSPVTVSDGSVW